MMAGTKKIFSNLCVVVPTLVQFTHFEVCGFVQYDTKQFHFKEPHVALLPKNYLRILGNVQILKISVSIQLRFHSNLSIIIVNQ